MSELSEPMIELTIEALTGTVYDLCVSPFETILGIKMKIQRLEGIPVYQQQLVHGNTELHDEFCLEEYSIGSGAQLKLLLAMRGGPIHAHRVQLEDPTFLEIAEVLEDPDLDHKYTVMLLRDGEALEMADFVVADETPGHVSPLPQTTSTEQETASSIALSKVTRNKMQDLMSRLRGRKQAEDNSSRIQGRGATKLLILDSCSSSRLLHSSAPSPVTPHPSATPTTSIRNPSTVHRKLVFPAEVAVPSNAHPQSMEQKQERHQRQLRRRQRFRRASCLPDKTNHHQKDIGDLEREMSQLGLREAERRRERLKMADPHLLPSLPTSSSLTTNKHTHHSGVPRLPEISVGHAPCLTASGRSQGRPQCTYCGRKMRAASTYTCRCGSMFCSRHRYAESHNCSFDYKTQGRETIARGNPLVVAPKLPKI